MTTPPNYHEAGRLNDLDRRMLMDTMEYHRRRACAVEAPIDEPARIGDILPYLLARYVPAPVETLDTSEGD